MSHHWTRTFARELFLRIPLGLRRPRGSDLLPLFEPAEHATAGGRLLYRLFRPRIAPDTRYPLLLCLHGSGGRGQDNERQILDVNGADANQLALPSLQRRHPCFILSPQCPNEAQWVDVDWSASAHRQPAEPAAPVALTLNLLGRLLADLPIDPARLYVTGLSMGGYGAWDLISRQQELFAAAVPVCGGGDDQAVARAAAVPVWAFHGSEDDEVPVENSRRMVASLKAAGGDVRYTEYRGVGHDSWVRAYREKGLWEWMFSKRRA